MALQPLGKRQDRSQRRAGWGGAGESCVRAKRRGAMGAGIFFTQIHLSSIVVRRGIPDR
ncbi:MAG: hypothetical protein AMXMBFR60_10310 [Chloroflexota bacterium]